MLGQWVVQLLFSWEIVLKNKFSFLLLFILIFSSSCLFLSDKKIADYNYKFILNKKVRYKSNMSLQYRVGSYGLGRTGSVKLKFDTEIVNRGVNNGVNRLYLTSKRFRIEKRSGRVSFIMRSVLRYLRKRIVLYLDNKGSLKKINYGYRNYADSSYRKLFSYLFFPNLFIAKSYSSPESVNLNLDKYLLKLRGGTKFITTQDTLSWARRITLLIEEENKKNIDVKLDIKQFYSKILSLPLKISNTIYFKMPITIKTGFLNLNTEANVIIKFSLQKINE